MDPILGKAIEGAVTAAVEKAADIQGARDMAIMLQQQESMRLGEITSREVIQREVVMERESKAVVEMQSRLDQEKAAVDSTPGDTSRDSSFANDVVLKNSGESASQSDGVHNAGDYREAFTSSESTIYDKSGVDLTKSVVEQLAEKSVEVFRNKNILSEMITPDGSTNLERMKDGLAPYVEVDGRLIKVELHHHRQNNDGPLIELDAFSHGSNRSELHPNQGKGEGRGEDTLWSQRVSEHWKQRSNEFPQQA